MQVELAEVTIEGERFQSLLDSHQAFWERAPENSLLRSTGVFAPSVPVRLPQLDGSDIMHAERLTPDMVDPSAMIDALCIQESVKSDLSQIAQRQSVASIGLGDLAPFSQPFFKIPWLEAMLGCPITMTEGQIWVERHPGGAESVIARGASVEHNAWFQLYLEFIAQLQGRLGDRYPVTTNTLLRGPSDLVAAVMGVREACVGWLDRPAQMARLLRVCTDVSLAVVEAGNAAVRPCAGRHMSAWGILAPQHVVRVQADHSTLLSASMYEKQILPFDREVIRSSSCCIFHIHNNGYHISPLLVQVPELDVLEVVVDPYPVGARREHEIEMMQMILGYKPFIVDANLPSVEEAERLLDCLPKRGLCFNARFDPAAQSTEVEGMPGAETWVLTPEAEG